jgi:pentatricopeptide repeat protein
MVEEILQTEVENGYHPNKETFNLLLASLSKLNKWQRMLEVYHHMVSKRIWPDIETYVILLRSLVYHKQLKDAGMPFA